MDWTSYEKRERYKEKKKFYREQKEIREKCKAKPKVRAKVFSPKAILRKSAAARNETETNRVP